MGGDVIKFAKGLITPESLTITGSLTPKQSKGFYSAIVNNNEFLKKVTTKQMNSLELFVDAYDVAEGILVRVPEGSEPTNSQKRTYSNIGCTLRALKAQLFADVTRSTIENNADNPNFEKELFNGFSIRFGNELVKLGFEGVDETGDSFENLNKGWIQVAKDSSDVKKDTYASTDKMVDRLSGLIENLDKDAKGPSTSILMSWSDWEKYMLELADTTKTAALFTDAKTKSFMGYPIEVNKYMPNGVYMATPLKNLVFGMLTKIYRERTWNARKRAIEYTFDVGNDYEIIIKKWVSLMTLTT